MNVQPHELIELKIPENVHEVILVEDGVLGRMRSRAYKNASTLWFFAILWFLVLVGTIIGSLIGRYLWE